MWHFMKKNHTLEFALRENCGVNASHSNTISIMQAAETNLNKRKRFHMNNILNDK